MNTVRLTTSQALVKYLCSQRVEIDGEELPLFAGVLAIFGHGNVAGMGEALYTVREELPTYRAHNEQSMALIAIAYSKATRRRRIMACTTSIGPGATNMVTAAAVAHVNRLPVLFLPGDTFASRAPDPVLQQIENFGNPNITANDCFIPVSRFWDRINHPEQLLTSLPVAIDVLVDPVSCGPVTLALPQDIQTVSYDFPTHFFEKKVHLLRHPGADKSELERAVGLIKNSQKPLLVAGGGVHYALACRIVSDFVEKFSIPVVETHAGKGALPWNHPCNAGSVGVIGSQSGNQLARDADVIIVVGSRLSDFTSASRSIFKNPDAKLININVANVDSIKHYSIPVVGDAARSLEEIREKLGDWKAPSSWLEESQRLTSSWQSIIDKVTALSEEKQNPTLPTEAQVLGAVNRACGPKDIIVCAAGGFPGELQKLWRVEEDNGYHLEYGYSCMGYEIPGALGVKLAFPEREVFAIMGDGGYMMMNSELATSVMLGCKIVLVLLDNQGFGCINRLQQACGCDSFNNLLEDCIQRGQRNKPHSIDFVAHTASMGAISELADSIETLENALERAKNSTKSYVIVIRTDPKTTTDNGSVWWEVAVQSVSPQESVKKARKAYEIAKKDQQQR